MKYKDYYQILGVKRTATADEIKQSYRKLAHIYHPDISKDPEGEAKFKEVAEAYAALKDPEKREAYDTLGQRRAGEQFTPPPDWQRHFHTEGSAFDDVDLSDLFAAFGGGRHSRQPDQHAGHPRAQHGQDYEIAAPVTLEQIFAGSEIEVRAELPEYDQNGLAHRVTRTFRITVPRGAADGQRLRLSGKGGPGINGGHAGDLYVALTLLPHRLYKVHGRDLTMALPLAPWEAALGATVKLPTLAGAVELNIKPGTINGQKLRLAKRGMPGVGGEIGELYAVVVITVPKKVSDKERVLYEQLAAASTFHPRQHFL